MVFIYGRSKMIVFNYNKEVIKDIEELENGWYRFNFNPPHPIESEAI